MSRRVVVNLVGDSERGRLAESRLVEEPFPYGGLKVCVALAFAAAAAGHEVELRGWIPRVAYEAFASGASSVPQVRLPARPPEADDVVVIPEGWREPLEYAQLALSDAEVWVFLLAAPGLFGWPFTDEPWSLPDPVTVELDRLARADHFRGMDALGLHLLTHSTGLAEAAHRAGVDCAYVGTGQPMLFPQPDGGREHDVVGLMENRWAPLVEQVLADLGSGVSADRIPAVANEEVLRRFGRARILVWPSRVEGHATIPIEARAMGCVPVALDTNPFASGLAEEFGAVVVSSVEDMAPAIRSLLGEPDRLRQLSEQGRQWAREHEAWGPFRDRVEAWVQGLRATATGHGALAASGSAFRTSVEQMRRDRDTAREELGVAKADLTEATENQERLTAELAWLRGRKLVEWAYRFDRAVRRR